MNLLRYPTENVWSGQVCSKYRRASTMLQYSMAFTADSQLDLLSFNLFSMGDALGLHDIIPHHSSILLAYAD
jgi:hypothetical protein